MVILFFFQPLICYLFDQYDMLDLMLHVETDIKRIIAFFYRTLCHSVVWSILWSLMFLSLLFNYAGHGFISTGLLFRGMSL